MPPVTAVLVGAGQRGYFVYGGYAQERPDQLAYVGVADPDPARRRRFADAHGLDIAAVHADWATLLAERRADVCVITTPDRHHVEPTLAALAVGYHVVLEKPIGSTVGETAAIAAAANGRVHVGHVLRYSPFFRVLHEVVASGRLGDIVNVAHSENIAVWHMAHSYVRGNWARTSDSSPMIVAKCCHDFDILHWNVTVPVTRLWSTGSLFHFRPDHAPPGALPRCTDGCPAGPICPFDARRIYLDEGRTGWPVHVITDDMTRQGRLEALETGPYGRCVYTAGSDAVDHQVVLMELENGASMTLTMHGHAGEENRTMRYDGTRASLRGVFGRRQHIEVIDHVSGSAESIAIPPAAGGHGGGDVGFIEDALTAVRDGTSTDTSAEASFESHLLAFAAEEARLTGTAVDVAAFRNAAQAGAA